MASAAAVKQVHDCLESAAIKCSEYLLKLFREPPMLKLTYRWARACEVLYKDHRVQARICGNDVFLELHRDGNKKEPDPSMMLKVSRHISYVPYDPAMHGVPIWKQDLERYDCYVNSGPRFTNVMDEFDYCEAAYNHLYRINDTWVPRPGDHPERTHIPGDPPMRNEQAFTVGPTYFYVPKLPIDS